MNRRSFLGFLGIAPMAAPAVAAAGSAPALPPINYESLSDGVRLRIGDAVTVIDMRADGSSRVMFDANRFDFNGETLVVPSLRV